VQMKDVCLFSVDSFHKSEDGKSWLNPSANQLYRALARKHKPIEVTRLPFLPPLLLPLTTHHHLLLLLLCPALRWPQPADAPSVAHVHDMVTANTWTAIEEYEELHKAECPAGPKLERFQGMDGHFSFKAKLVKLMTYVVVGGGGCK
jgi:cytochrome c heme-lyase